MPYSGAIQRLVPGVWLCKGVYGKRQFSVSYFKVASATLVEVASKGQFKSKTKSKAIKGKNRRIKFTDKRSTGMLYEVIPWDYVVEEVNKGSLRLPKGEVLSF